MGDDVRVHLTGEAARAAAAIPRDGDDGGSFVTGLVLRPGGESITLSTRPSGATSSGYGSAAFRDTLTLAHAEIRRIEVNELDATRTAVLSALGAGAVAAAVILVANANPSGGGGIGGGGGPRAGVEFPIRVPLGAP